MEESGCPTRSYFIIDTTKARLRDLTRGRRLFRIEANGISMRAAPFCIVILQYAYSIIGFPPPFLFSFFSSYSEAASWFNRVYRWLAWETVSKELNENLNVPSLFLVRKAHDDAITDVRKNGWNTFEFISKVIAMLNEDFLVRNKD